MYDTILENIFSKKSVIHIVYLSIKQGPLFSLVRF